jgi:myo-inositol-1(or 4)-monophosphatase
MLKTLGELSPQVAPQPKIHSLALRLGRVAQGTIDAALASINAYDWDLAAADLLVHEAGGLLTDFNGQRLRYNQPKPTHGALLAAGPGRHATLMEIVSQRRNAFA